MTFGYVIPLPIDIVVTQIDGFAYFEWPDKGKNDPEDIVRTEVLTQWVDTINPVINPSQWESCRVEGLRLNPEADTWLAIDLSPSRKEAALVASQRLEGDRFQVILLQTWHNPANLDDKAMANDVAEWVRKYPVQLVAYSAKTASAVAARLAPAGIRVDPIDGLDYAQSRRRSVAYAFRRRRHRHCPQVGSMEHAWQHKSHITQSDASGSRQPVCCHRIVVAFRLWDHTTCH